ncbi:hypothetical protein L686_03730 [Stutzerimonas stutzeri MF28]|nr:hypothetical protein L686_03730 [Stutzerimonas stutzeri MF28]
MAADSLKSRDFNRFALTGANRVGMAGLSALEAAQVHGGC